MSKEKNTALIALTAAAMILPGLCKKAEANPLDQKTTFDYKYTAYTEGEVPADKLVFGSESRYDIDVHHLKFKTPVSSDTELSVDLIQESMSGASPWWVQPATDADKTTLNGKTVITMSGATIEEERTELGLNFRSYNASSENTLSAGYSTENDYRSLSFGYSASFRFNQNLSTLDYGINASKDYIDASDVKAYPFRPKGKIKNRFGVFVGGSHVFTKNRVVSATVSYAGLDGYLSDPYKLSWVNDGTVPDSRPNSNNQVAVSVAVREFFPRLNAALHLDYRFYTSNWGLDSNTVELAWYQNLGKGWQFIPSVRAYQQTAAEFYQPYYLSTRADGFYSGDYRLSEFSATSFGVKLLKTFDDWYLDGAFQQYESTGDNPALISYSFYSVGAGIKF
jgi:Protein of unknown function (DUF3570)